MTLPFWRETQPNTHYRLHCAPAWSAPLAFEDGRFYDLCEIRVCDQHAEGELPSVPRWAVTMEAQERESGDSIFFKSNILNDDLQNELLQTLLATDSDARRWEALVRIARRRVEEYLRVHPFPAHCYPQLHPVILEIA